MECLDYVFFNDTATTEIYTLSLHDALPISMAVNLHAPFLMCQTVLPSMVRHRDRRLPWLHRHHGENGGRRADQGHRSRVRQVRSEEHTSELQSRQYLVCRLLLEKKKITPVNIFHVAITHNELLYFHHVPGFS